MTSSVKALHAFTALTWNIENVRKNIFVLAELLLSEAPSLVFLSEPQIYQSDLPSISKYLDHSYYYSLNSDDLYDHDLPLVCSRAKGGTMVLWSKWLDPFIKVVPTTSSSFLTVVLTLPDCRPSIHTAIYLPTHGQDTAFLAELAELQNCLDSLITVYDSPCIYIRGDANVNSKNTSRVNILASFMEHFSLSNIAIEHKTYHHFVGGGRFDSNVDVILHTASTLIEDIKPEIIKSIICTKVVPNMYSHHDAIVSKFRLPRGQAEKTTSECITAPRLDTQKSQILWTEKGIEEYSLLVSTQLRRLRENWLHPNSQASMSLLLNLTNSVLNCAATATNESKVLTSQVSTTQRMRRIPRKIRIAKNKLTKAHRKLKVRYNSANLDDYKMCRRRYHKAVRSHTMQENN